MVQRPRPDARPRRRRTGLRRGLPVAAEPGRTRRGCRVLRPPRDRQGLHPGLRGPARPDCRRQRDAGGSGRVARIRGRKRCHGRRRRRLPRLRPEPHGQTGHRHGHGRDRGAPRPVAPRSRRRGGRRDAAEGQRGRRAGAPARGALPRRPGRSGSDTRMRSRAHRGRGVPPGPGPTGRPLPAVHDPRRKAEASSPAGWCSSWSLPMCSSTSLIMAWVPGERLVGSRVMMAKVSIRGGSRLTQLSLPA